MMAIVCLRRRTHVLHDRVLVIGDCSVMAITYFERNISGDH